MRPSTYIALFASAVFAQEESATILNFFQIASTLTVLGSDASATTYENSCPSDNAGVSAIPSDLLSDSPTPTNNDFSLATTEFTTIHVFDAPTPMARMRRQDEGSGDDYSFCEPFTIIQGPQTYEMHLTDPTEGAWTVDMACNWEGEMTTADLTCTATQAGYVPAESVQTSETTVLAQSEIQSAGGYQIVALVGATGSSSGPSQTPAGSEVASSTKAASGSGASSPTTSASGSGAAGAQSTGLAPAGPLQTGAIIGGAVGLFAAAMAW